MVHVSDFSGCVTVVDGGQTAFDECRGLAEHIADLLAAEGAKN